MKILHITYDYPDILNDRKTVAVKNLIKISDEISDNYCISLNRVNAKKNEEIYYSDKKVIISTFGLPKGIFFRYTLKHSIDRIMNTDINFKSYNLIHAHKLTFEGPIAFYLYKKFNIQYIVSIRQTDFKVLKFKPTLRGKYKNILLECKNILLISPWMKEELISCFGSDFYKKIERKISILPNIVESKKYYYEHCDNGKFITIFNMKKSNIKIKNIYKVIKAINELKYENLIINLDIIGDGESRKSIENMIKKFDLKMQIRVLGKKNNSEIIKLIKDYKAFLLCSYPETFGLVYIEALISGIPIIYSKNTGIDGYFSEASIGIKVNHSDINEIKNAIIEINDKYDFYKKNIYQLQSNNNLDMFSKKNVLNKYENIIK